MRHTPWELASATWEMVRQERYEVALLPWGATEAHNRHLPYATDTLQAEAGGPGGAGRGGRPGAVWGGAPAGGGDRGAQPAPPLRDRHPPGRGGGARGGAPRL